jgi:hypothetical protein
VPWESSIRKNRCDYMHKIADMLSWMECIQRWYPKVKGTRLYSLLPLGSSYAAVFMKINASVLHGLCGRIYKQHGIALLDIPDEHVRTERYYQVNREILLRKAFDVSALETSQRKVAFEVKSNGYAALVLLQRPMTQRVGRATEEAHDTEEGKASRRSRDGSVRRGGQSSSRSISSQRAHRD